MQNELYAERIKAMGAQIDKIKVIGNFKFDTKPSSQIPEWTRILKSQEFTIIAGSTHRTEEDIILDAYIKIRNDFPATTLIIAPRHPERFREVEELIKKKGLEYIKRSELAHSSLLIAHSSKNTSISHELSAMSHQLSGVVVLLNVIGELASVYSVCDIAIMGGSFIEHGGQNPLEPAYWGKAIICGPHMENFPFIEEFYRSGGAIRVDSVNLYQALRELLGLPEKILSIGKAANKLYDKNSGATNRAMEIIGTYL
jgi:3-deoxy-D-manno-octulosonic-acid transferase